MARVLLLRFMKADDWALGREANTVSLCLQAGVEAWLPPHFYLLTLTNVLRLTYVLMHLGPWHVYVINAEKKIKVQLRKCSHKMDTYIVLILHKCQQC